VTEFYICYYIVFRSGARWFRVLRATLSLKYAHFPNNVHSWIQIIRISRFPPKNTRKLSVHDTVRMHMRQQTSTRLQGPWYEFIFSFIHHFKAHLTCHFAGRSFVACNLTGWRPGIGELGQSSILSAKEASKGFSQSGKTKMCVVAARST